MALTPEQLQLFRHNGFLVLPEGLSQATVNQLKEAIWRDVRNVVEPVTRDTQGQVTRLSNIWDRDPIFRQVLICKQVMEPLEDLLGPDIVFLKNRHNHATLRRSTDAASDLHRDVRQWTRTIVTILFYLEDTTLENGCTRIVPGTHLMWGRQGHGSAVDKFEATGVLEQAIPVPMPAGGLLAIDSMIIHGVGRNCTNETRMSMTAGYHSVDEFSQVDEPNRVLVHGEQVYSGNDR